MTFRNILGQDQALGLIKDYLQGSRVAGGYLFSGPEGVGKMMAAIAFAKAMNCEKADFNACGSCPSCVKIGKAAHPDVHILGGCSFEGAEEDAPSSIKIEEIRQLQRDIFLRPYEGRHKVFIINNAHNLTADASNALLKVLEEPPRQSVIILVSSKPSLLFATIVSRCQVIKFNGLERSRLEEILKADYGLEPVPAHFLAYYSEGRLGLALRFKNSGLYERKNRIIENFGIIKKENSRLNLPESRQELREILNILAAWFRDLYLLKTGVQHSELINLDRRSELLKHMTSYTFTELDEILHSLSDSVAFLDQNVNAKLLMANLKLSLKG